MLLLVGYQLNDVIASTAIMEYDVILQIMDLREYGVRLENGSRAKLKLFDVQALCCFDVRKASFS